MIEICIYIILAAVFGAVVRIYKSKKNGIVYNLHRDPKNIHPKLQKYNSNLHFISSPANYFQQFAFFFMVLPIARLLAPEVTFNNIGLSILSAGLIAVGQSTLASYWWQIWINRGAGLPDIDPNENHMSEFAWGKINFWFSTGKLFNGERSIYLPFLGAIQILAGLLLLFIL